MVGQKSFSKIRKLKQPYPMLLTALIIVVLAGFIGAVFLNRSDTLANQKEARLLFIDRAKNKLKLTDGTGKQLQEVAYPAGSYPNFEAATPKGQILVSLNLGSTEESFLFFKDGKPKTLNNDAVKALRSAAIVGASHQISFSDENTAVYSTCPDTCKLVSLDVSTGRAKTISDTGVKGLTPAPVYLLGLSGDNKSAFLRVVGANKLGKATDSIYQVDLKTAKVMSEAKLPSDVGYILIPSPDRNSYVYQVGSTGAETTIHVFDLETSKDTAVKWGDIPQTFIWSPEGQKVLFYSAQVNLPQDATRTAKDTSIAYLDMSKSKKEIIELQNVKDQAVNQVAYADWLDSDTIIYAQNTTSRAYDFTSPTSKTYKQALSSKQPLAIGPEGFFEQVVRW